MSRVGVIVALVVMVLTVGLFVPARAAAPETAQTAQAALDRLEVDVPGVMIHQRGDRVTRVYGRALVYGATPEQSAELFRLERAGVFGVQTDDLEPVGFSDGAALAQPLMYDRATGTYKFTLLRYGQYKEGIPVFRADLRVLVRNAGEYPVVLAASALRNLGDFVVVNPRAGLGAVDAEAAEAAVAAVVDRSDMLGAPIAGARPGFVNFSQPETVIWAGVDDMVVEPRVAVSYVADNYGSADAERPEKWLFVADAQSGEILYQESLIIFTDVTGKVSGMATEGPKAAFCSSEVNTPMAWADASIQGGSSTFANASGEFTIPNGGFSSVTVESPMSGEYFYITDYAGPEEDLAQSVIPPGPANFTHNVLNTDEYVRAQVNGYVQANVVRDFVVTNNPSYPVISGQTNFPVNVNRVDVYCPGNAWYDYSAINFCLADSGYPNTAWSSVIHHEYGHHTVNCGGSGQDQYGEGMSDCMAVLIADDPILGYGFYGDCDTGLRTADNTYQYPCTGEAHVCGNLLSGCIWSIRNELIVTEPVDYLDILSYLTVNSIPMHSGSLITPQIAIDFLTLDDDDSNIGNGTPHRTEICAGFADHSIDCPALTTGMSVTPGDSFISEGPNGGPFVPGSTIYTIENMGPDPINYSVTKTEAWLTITNGSGSLNVSQTADVTVSINSSADSLGDGTYTDTVNFINTTDHVGDTTRGVSLGVGVPVPVYTWTLDSNPGWTTAGLWAFGQPTGGGGQYGNPDPTSGHTGTNVYGYNLSGDYENYLPERHLTTTAIDCTGLSQVSVRFWRWLGVEQPAYDHAYVRVSNNGTSWTTVWQNMEEITDSSWTQVQYDISAVADNESTVYVRWTMGETDVGWQYCGWNIDDIQILALGGGDDCSNGVLDTGEDRIDCGGPCPPCDCTADGECDNGTYCDGAETCDAYGTCQAGPPVDCPDDGLYCNGTEFCDEGADACASTGDPCTDDGLYCNGTESCDEVGDQCVSSGDPCTDDGLYCNGTESCDEVGDQCVSSGDPCTDDGLYCNGTESCDEVGDQCVSSGDPCTDDGLYCNGTEFCDEGGDVCDSTGDPCTDDGLYCNGTEFCNEGGDVCDSTGDPCVDDGLYCNGTEFCDEGGDVCDSTGDPCVLPEVCDEGADMCVSESTTISSVACCMDQGKGGPATVEPRQGGVSELVLQTADPVEAGSTTATATCVNNVYSGTVTVTADGTMTVMIAMDPLPDQDCCTIAFDGGIVDSVGVRLLAGDVNGDGSVSTADASSIKQRMGIVVGASDFWYDVNMDGNVSTADASSIKQRLGNVAPACP